MRQAARSDELLKELFLENAVLMRTLHLTEVRQKEAEEHVRQLKTRALPPTNSTF